MPRPTPISFSVHRGRAYQGTRRFEQGIIKIGRAPAAHLVLADESVFRMHAVVEVRDGGDPVVIDLGGRTLLNLRPVTKATLRTGDRLTLGGFELVVGVGPGARAEEAGPRDQPTRVSAAPAGLLAPRPSSPVAPVAPAPPAVPLAPPEPDIERPARRVVGTRFVTPGTAAVVRSRRTGEVRSVRTHGRVMVWPLFEDGWELDLAAFTVAASATGVHGARSADGLLADVSLRVTLRPRPEEAALRELVDAFGESPTRSVVARRVVDALAPQLAAALAALPWREWSAGRVLELEAPLALGYGVERAEVLRVGPGAPTPSDGYRERRIELEPVRFVGTFPATPAGGG